MTRTNLLSPMKDRAFLAWGKTISANASVFIFAAALIVCSVTAGCSSDKPKPVTTSNPVSAAPPVESAAAAMPAPMEPPATQPARKQAAPKKPASANYTDKTYGVTFEYPRRYAIETGDAAAELLISHPVAMNFIAPGGVALAAVELPETSYGNTDFSSAFFNVSVHKTLTADQCSEFSVPQPSTVPAEARPEPMTTAASTPEPSPVVPATATSDAKSDSAQSTQPAASTDEASKPKPVTTPAASADSRSNAKLMLGDLELVGTEAVSGEGRRQSDSKYFHVYQNGACYEFAMNVTTNASEQGLVKHVDRDKVFHRLEQILSTVKINPVPAGEVTAEAPKPAAAETPAQ
jgi:hypothetical protein